MGLYCTFSEIIGNFGQNALIFPPPCI